MNYIFDFDGTIIDSLPAMVAVYNKVVRNNENPLTVEEIEKFRGMPTRKALKNLGVRWWQMPKLLFLGMGDFKALLPTLKPFNGMPDVIKRLHRDGHKLYVLSSNNHENVVSSLTQHNLLEYFEDIYSDVGLFSKSKFLRRLIKENKLVKKDTIYVGDETRDIKATKIVRLKIIAVTWGLNNKQILKKQKPTYLVDKPEEIFNIRLEDNK